MWLWGLVRIISALGVSGAVAAMFVKTVFILDGRATPKSCRLYSVWLAGHLGYTVTVCCS